MTILLEQLDEMAEIVRTQGLAPTGAWGKFHGQSFPLPDWFDRTLDPSSPDYREQQFRLWRLICGIEGDYDAARDEQAPEIRDLDAIRFPAFFARRDPAAVVSAGDHIIAMGHLLKRSGLVPGNWALEYGAGFGQTALALARLGVNVDTVDINPLFNAAVDAQGRHFNVPLRSFQGAFGDNPRGDDRYDMVLFYEAFHHCADFAWLIGRLRELLLPGGRVLMAGEPIVGESSAVPYPWGIRLDAETVAVMRWRHWLELGYQEDFLVRAFIEGGFSWHKHPCAITHYGDVHVFSLRPARVELSGYTLPAAETAGWHLPEAGGRWTKAKAVLPIEARQIQGRISLCVTNHHPNDLPIEAGTTSRRDNHILAPGERRIIEIATAPGDRSIGLECQTISPASSGGEDPRALGVFVHWLEYG